DSAAGEAWVEAHLPPTPLRTRTSRGHHYGYRHPGSRVPNRVQLADGVDIRGDGGYVVAPGSRHRSGIYYGEAEPWPMSFDGLPVFPIEILATAVSATSQRIPALPSAISIGSRNDRLFREACRLRRHGWNEPEIASSLRVLNQQRCDPPLDDPELQNIA